MILQGQGQSLPPAYGYISPQPVPQMQMQVPMNPWPQQQQPQQQPMYHQMTPQYDPNSMYGAPNPYAPGYYNPQPTPAGLLQFIKIQFILFIILYDYQYLQIRP